MTSKPRILVVDDDPLGVKLIGAIFFSDNYQIIGAFNGEQALKLIKERRPDLILLDIKMPGIDGFEVIRRLKDSIETKDTPIIVLTASDEARYKVMGHEVGVNGFLKKPINIPELKSKVKSLLGTKKDLDKSNRL